MPGTRWIRPRQRFERRFALALLLTGVAGCAHLRPPSQGHPGGAVAVPERHAAEVGIDILDRGGNAVDAAIAVQFALAVTFPVAGNLGGGGFMMVAEPGGAVRALDYRETAPAAAHPALFLDAAGEVVDGLSLWSGMAAGVPGTVVGMWEAHHRLGSLPWGELLAPAIRLAEEGFLLDASTATSFVSAADDLDRNPARFRQHGNFRAYFHGSEGDLFVQKELATTLRRIAEQGTPGFYSGETARLIVAQVAASGGILTLDDLERYRAHWRAPVVGTYRGHGIASMPPPSSGGVALIELLNMLETFHMPRRHSPEHVNLLAEVEKLAFADRALHLGDPDYYPVPLATLLDKSYARKRAATIDPGKRTPPALVKAGSVEGESTTHFTIVDRHGMAVANTTTLNTSYGSGIVVTGAGFLLNNEMDDFSARAGVPNAYGVVGGEANKVEGSKRMLSSMSPTFVFAEDGGLWLVLGSPGGPTIFTTVLQVVSNRIDHGLDLKQAVAAPRFHHQWPPPTADSDPIRVESHARYTLPRATLDRLRDMGYDFSWRGNIGCVHAIELARGKVVAAAADPRGTGVALFQRPLRATSRAVQRDDPGDR